MQNRTTRTLLGKDSFTKFGNELLQDTVDLENLGLTSLQKIYFKEVKKQLGSLQSQLSYTISIKEMINRFKKWREQTPTSPCSRHLRHYNALLTFDDERDKELDDFNVEILTVYNTIINAALTLCTPLTR